MNKNRHILSKSTFMRSYQCSKSLYLHKFHSELRDEMDDGQEAIFERGISIGQLAQNLFSGGVDASPPTPYEYQKSVDKTTRLIREGARIIYEAAFQHKGVLAAIDILVNQNGKWKAYEVKSSTSAKEQFILDAALQYHVITNSGIQLSDISIIHLNNEYVRKRELNLHELFVVTTVLDLVKEKQEFVKKQIMAAKELLQKKVMPDTDIGVHCDDPYPCDFKGHCWKHIPEISVFNISRLNAEKKFELYNSGVINLKDVPESFPLNAAQKMQVHCFCTGETRIDKKGIREFLNSLIYPLYFLDFETFGPAIPLYENSKPYQQIPFQYSLHYKKMTSGEVIHYSFLAEAGPDPRPGFIESLLSNIADKGDILVYNRPFETTRLKELAAAFPEYASRIEGILKRIKDLMLPFQQKLYYTPSMNGSYSIKSVLPALVPELSYKNLEIANGGSASGAFEQLIYEKDKKYIAETRKHLLEYCKLDTWGMVKILSKIESLK